MMGGGTKNAVDHGNGNVLAGDHAHVTINDLDSYEAHVARRVAERVAELDQLHTAQLAAKDAEKDAMQMQIDLLRQQIELDRARMTDPATAYAEFRAKIAELERLLADATDATAAIGANRIADARAALEAGDYSKADAIFAEVEEVEAQAVLRAADAAYGRGLIAEEQGRWSAASDHYAKAARLNPTFDTLQKAGEFLSRAGRHADGLRRNEDLLALALDDFGPEDAKTATALNALALSYGDTGRFAEAEPLFRQALEIDCKTLGEAHPVYASHLNNLGNLLWDAGRFAEAEPLYREALEVDRKKPGKAHPNYAIHLNNLANLLMYTKRFAEAERLYRQALEIDRKTRGEEHPDYAIHLGNLANLLLATGRFAEAEPLYAQVLEIDRKTLGEANPEYANHLGSLANLRMYTGRLAAAEPLYRQALEIMTKAYGPDHQRTKTVADNLDDLLTALTSKN